MMIDGRNLPAGSVVEVDLCIIGGGPAGISLAMQFAGKPNLDIALVESGGRRWDARTQELSEAEGKGQPYYPVKETHLRVLGGSTLSYGGICTELTELDFEKRSWVPNSGWPIKKPELEPYVARANELLGVSGAAEPQAHWESTEATTWKDVLVSRPPTRFGDKYAADLEKSRNVTTYLHSTVSKLEMHPDGGHVPGVVVKCLGGNHYRIVARHYVLAGGGIEVPRLLLASNDIVSSGIANQHDNVGRYFQEHLRAVDRYIIPRGMKSETDRIAGASGTLRFSRLALTDQTLRDENLVDYFANLTFGFSGQDTPQWDAIRRVVIAYKPPWNDSPYLQSIGGGRSEANWEDMKIALIKPHRTMQSLVGAGFRPRFMRKWVEVGSSMEQVPRRKNRVALARERDELGMPRAELHWSFDEMEKRAYYRGRELILEELDRLFPGLSQNRMDDPEQWPDHIIGTWHHAGTTRMHTDPKLGVVDADAKVHGVDNLFIASSSIFPTSGATAPTKTMVCLALRLAEHLDGLLHS